ncbi:MAG: hypothetical protein AAF242_11040 [Bacteroidota bacterium]
MELPYREIPESPDNYKTGSVLARMIDGLGYRYYWATEGLTEKDLAYLPSADGSSTLETLEHIYGLSQAILEVHQGVNVGSTDRSKLDYQGLRKKTLENLWEARQLCVDKKAKQIAKMKIVFKRGESTNQFPYWNLLNGQMADAIYHTGQIVMMRGTSGNPINPKVKVFMVKNRN